MGATEAPAARTAGGHPRGRSPALENTAGRRPRQRTPHAHVNIALSEHLPSATAFARLMPKERRPSRSVSAGQGTWRGRQMQGRAGGTRGLCVEALPALRGEELRGSGCGEARTGGRNGIPEGTEVGTLGQWAQLPTGDEQVRVGGLEGWPFTVLAIRSLQSRVLLEALLFLPPLTPIGNHSLLADGDTRHREDRGCLYSRLWRGMARTGLWVP